jgi:hypothetical protein
MFSPDVHDHAREKGKTFSATAPYLSLGVQSNQHDGGTNGQEWEIEQEGTPEQKDKEIDESRREEAA